MIHRSLPLVGIFVVPSKEIVELGAAVLLVLIIVAVAAARAESTISHLWVHPRGFNAY